MGLEVNGELIPVGGGDPIPLVRDVLTLGRRESCDICLRFPNVSSQHCELTYYDGYWVIRDLGSTNGVKVNGTRVQKKILHPGDEITIAKRRYTIEYALTAGKHAMEEMMEDDVMSQGLLEKAGLVRPRRRRDEEPEPRPDTFPPPEGEG
ncbi:MAG TPA: FHA domain-containing protein [Gemmataceae bacterium]|jgi:adenylate cyclase|nr:FHA domain-containing protein [Gemmataceae bacterium]